MDVEGRMPRVYHEPVPVENTWGDQAVRSKS